MEGVLTLVALFEWVECMECVCALRVSAEETCVQLFLHTGFLILDV